MEKQIDKKRYNFRKYCAISRWCGYWHQLNEIITSEAGSVLEIGLGDKTIGGYIKNNTDIKYSSMDIAEDVNPDIVGSIDKIPVEDDSFGLVCAFEVLEHLPFEKFEISLKEMARVSKTGKILISLPHWGRHFGVEFRLPYFKKIQWQYKFKGFSAPKHEFNGQHYWEIGKRDYSLKKILKSITSHQVMRKKLKMFLRLLKISRILICQMKNFLLTVMNQLKLKKNLSRFLMNLIQNRKLSKKIHPTKKTRHHPMINNIKT